MKVTNAGLVTLRGDEVDADVALTVIALFTGCGMFRARTYSGETRLELFWHWTNRDHVVIWQDRARALIRGLEVSE